MVFGPNNLLSLTIGMSQGISAALVAAIGRLLAFVIMIVISAAGVGAIMVTSPILFTLIKWIGALYLLWLGVLLIRKRSLEGDTLAFDTSHARILDLFKREFIVAGSNPKAILIFTAFFPQFIKPASYWQSFAILGILFLILEMLAILVYSFAGVMLKKLGGDAIAHTWINRLSGGFMIAFSIALILSNRSPGI